MVLADRYRVVRHIGQGGMGVVLEAEHTLSGKRVAIKWLHPKMASEPDAEQRFLREARAAARVRHPNVVDVYDVLEHDGAVFLVMELLEGESLQRLLERGRLPVPELIALLVEAMRGVSAAHKQGVVHRDIKPENIFLARMPDRIGPCPKLLDFGISKFTERTGIGDSLKLTQTGEALGTPMYMSYEQLQGAADIDGRADVYAFAVILYEALTGRPPYVAETFSQLLLKIATEEPVPPKKLRAEVPSELDAVIRRAMAKDRQKRTPSVAALIAELSPFASEAAFRAQMTEQREALPSIRPPSSPSGSRGRAQSGLRPALRSTPADGRSSSERALQRMRPRGPRMAALALAVIALASGVFALAVAGGYLLRDPQAMPKPEAVAPSAAASPPRPADPTVAVTPPRAAITPPPSASPAAAHVISAPTPEPKAASSEPRRSTSRPRPAAAKAKRAQRQHPPTTTAEAAVPAGAQPSATAAPAPEPEKPSTRLRAGQPHRQDF
jgi:serine/threonine-protein kinase